AGGHVRQLLRSGRPLAIGGAGSAAPARSVWARSLDHGHVPPAERQVAGRTPGRPGTASERRERRHVARPGATRDAFARQSGDREPGGVMDNDIAIVGIAGRFPSARTPAELWRLLRDGKEATQWLTDEELRTAGVADAELNDPNYVRAGLVLPDMEKFDPDF